MATGIIITLLVIGIWVGLLVFLYWGSEYALNKRWLLVVLGVVAFALLAGGEYYGLAVAPPERDMGDVYRIIYAHVPEEWMSMMALTLNFVFSVGFLIRKNWRLDALAEATAEAGLLLAGTGVVLGSIWARPTWGVWWTTDPRLITAAVMVVSYAAYMALRRFMDDPERRARWSAVVAILAAADLPLVWFSVKWWASIHQMQSSPETVPDPSMRLALRWNGIAFLFILIFFSMMRYRISREARKAELTAPDALPPTRVAA
jgi:heme exporter protein C